MPKSIFRYLYIKKSFDDFYQESLFCNLFKKLFSKPKVSFQNSFLAKIIQTKDDGGAGFIIRESRLYLSCRNFLNVWKDRLKESIENSGVVFFSTQLKKDFSNLPVRTTSLILVPAVLAVLAAGLLFRKGIGLYEYIASGVIILLGLSGLNCNTSWSELKESSFFFQKRISS